MITEKDVFNYLLTNAELRLGRPCSDFGEMFRKKENYKGPLTLKAMGRELWNKYCRERNAYLRKRSEDASETPPAHVNPLPQWSPVE